MLLAVLGSLYSQQQVAEIFLTGSDTTPRISAPIAVGIALINTSASDIRIHETNPAKEYQLSMFDQRGRAVALTPYGKEMNDPQGPLDRNVVIVLRPKEQSPPVRLDLRKFFEIAGPGEYRVLAKRRVYGPGTGSGSLITSKQLILRVAE